MPAFNDDEKSWKLYLKALEELVGVSSFTNQQLVFQPLTILRKVEWDIPNAPKFNKYLQAEFLNNLPIWGGFGDFTSNKLSDVYQDFLTRLRNAISVSDSNQLTSDELAQVERFKFATQEAKLKKEFYISKAELDWRDYLKNNPEAPRNEFFKRKFLADNSNYKIATSYQERETYYADQIFMVLSRINPDVKLISGGWQAFINESNQELLPLSINDETETDNYIPVYIQSITSDPQQIFKFKALNPAEVSMKIDDASTESTTIQSKWRGSLGFRVKFWHFGAGANSSKLEQETKQTTTSISLKFSNLGKFEIKRGRWYNEYIIRKIGKLLPEFFGVNGELSVIPTEIVYAKGIEVNIVVDKTLTSRVEEHFKASGRVGLGPFTFGAGNYSKDYISSKLENKGNSFTIKTQGDDVYILGFVCYLPNYNPLENYKFYTSITKNLKYK